MCFLKNDVLNRASVLCLWVFSILSDTAMAQKHQHQPINSNYLIEKGISPRVLDAAASDLLQEGSFVEHLLLEIDEGGQEKQLNMEIVYDPSYKDGLDLRIVVDRTSFSESEKKKIKRAIEKSHSFSRLSRYYLYDESSLKLISTNEDTQVLEFSYDRSDLEPELKRLRRMKGHIYIVNDKLEKVVLTATKKLKSGMENYVRTVYFKKTNEQGGYIITSAIETYGLGKDKGRQDYKMTFTTRSYRSLEGNELTWENQGRAPSLLLPNETDTITAKLGGVLPFFGKSATKLGYSIPRAAGLNFISHFQSLNLEFDGIQIGFNDSELSDLSSLFDFNSSSLAQTTNTYMVKGDVWLFPFLNVMGLVGIADNGIDGEIVLEEDVRQFLVDISPIIGLQPEDIPRGIPLQFDVRANLLGGGLTLAGGIDDFFATLNYQFLIASVPDVNTTTTAHAFTPLIGYDTPYGFRVMVGAQGQYYSSDIAGFIEFGDGEKLRYNVSFLPVRWNAMAGVYAGFGKHVEFSLQLGMGPRSSVTGMLGYRF